jgi:hypothetical protein
MCFGLLNYLLSGATTHPAFGHYNISNWCSNDISHRLKALQVPLSIAHLNPASLAGEIDLLKSVQAGNAIQRNYRFLARRMLKHLDSLTLRQADTCMSLFIMKVSGTNLTHRYFLCGNPH